MEISGGNGTRKYPTLTLIAILAISMATLAGIAGGLIGGEFGGGEQQPELEVNFNNTQGDDITITHEGGDSVEIQKIQLEYQTFEGDDVVIRLSETTPSDHGVEKQFSGNEFSEGDSFTVPTDDISMIWIAEQSDATVFMGSYP